MHSRKLNSIVRIIVTVTVLTNIFFCAASVYYIANCNGIVVREIKNTATHYVSAPVWKGLNFQEKWSFPKLNSNFSEEYSSSRSRHQCPETPPNRVGKLSVNGLVKPQYVFNTDALAKVQPGGLYSPECLQRETVAIIIPYRERARQLQILLYHLHTFLQGQQLQYAVFVVEMAHPTQFNRGMLANVGFLTAREMLNFTCYIIHDVDLLPANDRNLYRCSKNPAHLAVSSSKYGYKLPYNHYIGGVIAFTPRQYVEINGFSNAYFGWGKEDDDLYKRISNADYGIERPDPGIGVYEEIAMRDIQDISNPDNPMKDGLYLRAEKRFRKDGVNRVLFNRLALELQPLYTWVYVNTTELSVLQLMRAADPGLRETFARVKPVGE